MTDRTGRADAEPASPPADAAGGNLPGAPARPANHDEHHRIAEAVERALQTHMAQHLARVEQVMAAHVRDAAVSGRRHLDEAARACTPAWMRVTEGETRWPVALAVVVAIDLQLVLPPTYVVPPRWLLPGLELALLFVLTVANPRRINVERRWLRVTGLTLVAVATLANVYGAIRLVWRLIHGEEHAHATLLLAIGGAIWLTNVIIFALWYWEFDRGGPAARAHARQIAPDFQFTQMTMPDSAAHQDWEPTFIDYLYLSFTNATAFSPTDTLPMTRWAKMLMLFQSAVSLATVALVIARAVNILQ
jgi:uncharacterized membrane protein